MNSIEKEKIQYQENIKKIKNSYNAKILFKNDNDAILYSCQEKYYNPMINIYHISLNYGIQKVLLEKEEIRKLYNIFFKGD